MQRQIFFLFVFLFSWVTGFASLAKPLSVVVVGGGPTGLAAAIEAHEAGADVLVVEKRNAYARLNTLFLYTVTLNLFDKWQLKVPLMTELEFKGEKRGFVLIKDLEESLARKVDELGIQKIRGKFKGFAVGEKAAIIQTQKGHISLPYDILVGADGANSRVREKLGIPTQSSGEAIAGIAMVSATNPEKKIGVEIGKHSDVFVKKVTVPHANILLVQNRPTVPLKELTQREIAKFCYELGWLEEARKIEAGGILNIENIRVNLKRAKTFVDPHKAVILLGDAAGCGSFYQGMGANSSLKTAELAGIFFREFRSAEASAAAWDQFNQSMEKVIDTLIKDSIPLFEK